MRPADVKPAARAGAAGDDAEARDNTTQHTPHAGDDQPARPFVLTIHGDRATVWGYYPTHDEADAIGLRLRVHGFDARVHAQREAQR